MGEKVDAKKLVTSEEKQMTTAKELAAATQAQRLAEGYRKRFEAAAMGADNADDVACSLARTLLRRASGSPQPEPVPADVRDVVREALEGIDAGYAKSFPQGPECEAMGLLPELRCQWRRVREALAALDAAPTEKVVGYGVLLDGGLDGFTCFREGREEAERFASDMRWKGSDGSRIVRLVAEDE